MLTKWIGNSEPSGRREKVGMEQLREFSMKEPVGRRERKSEDDQHKVRKNTHIQRKNATSLIEQYYIE